MTTEFIVTKKETCVVCDGTGSWPENIRPMCPICYGTGFIKFEVELSEAIRQLQSRGVI